MNTVSGEEVAQILRCKEFLTSFHARALHDWHQQIDTAQDETLSAEARVRAADKAAAIKAQSKVLESIWRTGREAAYPVPETFLSIIP